MPLAGPCAAICPGQWGRPRRETKTSPFSWPRQERWCPGRLCHGAQPVSAVFVAVVGWQGRARLAAAEIRVYGIGRDPVPRPARACWGNWDPRALMGPPSVPEHCPGVSLWRRKQTCPAGRGPRPAQHLSLQPCVTGYPKRYLEARYSEGSNRHATRTQAKRRIRAVEGTGLIAPRRDVARRKQHPAPLLSWSQVCPGQSRIQARGPTFAQAASQSRAGHHRHRGGKPVSSQPLKQAGAAHAGVGQGELGSETGTRGTLQASSWARRGAPGRGEQAERSPGEN